MKKFFIIAAAALVAITACTKIEDIDTAPAKKITFQAASYVPQTKYAGIHIVPVQGIPPRSRL